MQKHHHHLMTHIVAGLWLGLCGAASAQTIILSTAGPLGGELMALGGYFVMRAGSDCSTQRRAASRSPRPGGSDPF